MIYAVVGPTGVGKTKLSIMLAKKINAEIINCDSMQIYKEMNIGTAKITEEEKQHITHHLLNIKSIYDNYSVYDYQKDGRKIIDQLLNQNKNIVIVGGTGLYLKALIYDYKFSDEQEKNYEELSNEEIIKKIKDIDNTINIDFNNRRRLERCLCKLENKSSITNNKNTKIYNCKIIGLTCDRKNLYHRIDLRVDEMIANGLLNEVKTLYNKKKNSRAISTAIGYKELYNYFDGKISLNEAIDKIKSSSRKYAKRQYTFFNNQFEDIEWFNIEELDFDEILSRIIK